LKVKIVVFRQLPGPHRTVKKKALILYEVNNSTTTPTSKNSVSR